MKLTSKHFTQVLFHSGMTKCSRTTTYTCHIFFCAVGSCYATEGGPRASPKPGESKWAGQDLRLGEAVTRTDRLCDEQDDRM